MYLAAIVVFRVSFAAIYILIWKWRFNCKKNYGVKEVNLDAEFKRVKKTAINGDSTDEEEMERQITQIFKIKKDAIIKKTGDINPMRLSDATMEYMISEEFDENMDSDDDQREFADAQIEEAEDRLIQE